MRSRLTQLAARLLREEEGQATTEYGIVITVTMLLLLGVSAVVVGALATYYFETTSLICLPIP